MKKLILVILMGLNLGATSSATFDAYVSPTERHPIYGFSDDLELKLKKGSFKSSDSIWMETSAGQWMAHTKIYLDNDSIIESLKMGSDNFTDIQVFELMDETVVDFVIESQQRVCTDLVKTPDFSEFTESLNVTDKKQWHWNEWSYHSESSMDPNLWLYEGLRCGWVQKSFDDSSSIVVVYSVYGLFSKENLPMHWKNAWTEQFDYIYNHYIHWQAMEDIKAFISSFKETP